MTSVPNMRLDGFVVHGPSVIRGSCFGVTLCDLDYVDPGIRVESTSRSRSATFVTEPIDCMTCLAGQR